MGRTAAGVRGMTLDNDPADEVIGMICIKDKEAETVLVISEQGYGKRSHIDDYRITNRGGKGVKTINITDKTGKLVAIKNVTEQNDVMIINKSGIAIRMTVLNINVIGRATQGVRLINLEKRHDEIASVCKVLTEADEEDAAKKAQDEAMLNRIANATDSDSDDVNGDYDDDDINDEDDIIEEDVIDEEDASEDELTEE
jgi:DNA gyrase subunit A